jgi:enamine deaminase RidA (YjgF/YER057c/UK114 family)
MSKAYTNPHDLFPSQQYGFSQVVSTRGTTTVYLSGQVAWNARGEIVHPLDLGGQTRRAFRKRGDCCSSCRWNSRRYRVIAPLHRGGPHS